MVFQKYKTSRVTMSHPLLLPLSFLFLQPLCVQKYVPISKHIPYWKAECALFCVQEMDSSTRHPIKSHSIFQLVALWTLELDNVIQEIFAMMKSLPGYDGIT